MSDANRPAPTWPGENPDPGEHEAGSVHVIATPTRTRVVLCGEIDAAIGPDLADAASDAEAACLPVDVDARRVTFMDSSGFTLLARLATRSPGRLRIIRPPEVVRFLLDVTHLGALVDVVDTDPAGPSPTTAPAPSR